MTHALTKDDMLIINEALDNLLDIDPSSKDAGRICELMGVFNGQYQAVITTSEPML